MNRQLVHLMRRFVHVEGRLDDFNMRLVNAGSQAVGFIMKLLKIFRWKDQNIEAKKKLKPTEILKTKPLLVLMKIGIEPQILIFVQK